MRLEACEFLFILCCCTSHPVPTHLACDDHDTQLRTRAMTLPKYMHAAADILAAALKLLHAELPIEVRLMGLRMSGFLEQVGPWLRCGGGEVGCGT